jgi:catechol 2,3-dioxygenase-like lactoylglutathione lyase family enzyme
MLKRVDHIEIVVKDLAHMSEFFQTLGFQVVRRTEHHGGAVELKLPGPDQVIFELHTLEAEENPGINHIAFLVEDSQATVDALTAKGIEFETGPYHFPATGRTLTNFRDPQGFRVQFTEYVE